MLFFLGFFFQKENVYCETILIIHLQFTLILIHKKKIDYQLIQAAYLILKTY